MYDGNKWVLVNKEELIDNIYYDKRGIILDKIDEYNNSLSDIKKEALGRWIRAEEENDVDEINMVKDRIKLLAYNKRRIVIEKIEQQRDKKNIKSK
jgi:hypothetical protein